ARDAVTFPNEVPLTNAERSFKATFDHAAVRVGDGVEVDLRARLTSEKHCHTFTSDATFRPAVESLYGSKVARNDGLQMPDLGIMWLRQPITVANEEMMGHEIAHDLTQVYVVESRSGRATLLVGYSHLSSADAPAATEVAADLFMHRAMLIARGQSPCPIYTPAAIISDAIFGEVAAM